MTSPHFPKLQELLAEQLGLNKQDVVPDAKLEDDLGADSLDCVEIVLALEEEYGLSISDEDSDRWKTMADVVEYLDREVSAS